MCIYISSRDLLGIYTGIVCEIWRRERGLFGRLAFVGLVSDLISALRSLEHLSFLFISKMPTFKANDGVSLHYETYGSSNSPPLILVGHHAILDRVTSLTPIQVARLHGLRTSLQAQY